MELSFQTDASLVRPQTAACETGFIETAARPNSLASVMRYSLLIKGAEIPANPTEHDKPAPDEKA